LIFGFGAALKLAGVVSKDEEGLPSAYDHDLVVELYPLLLGALNWSIEEEVASEQKRLSQIEDDLQQCLIFQKDKHDAQEDFSHHS
jgi:hypothetical protein